MHVFYAATTLQQLPAGHRFPMAKYEMLRARLDAELPMLRLSLAETATDGELALVHTPAYIDAVDQGSLSPQAQREIGFPWSQGMVERARRSVGARYERGDDSEYRPSTTTCDARCATCRAA